MFAPSLTYPPQWEQHVWHLPGDQLAEGVCELDAGLLVEDGGAGVTQQVRRHDVLLGQINHSPCNQSILIYHFKGALVLSKGVKTSSAVHFSK